MEVYSDTNLWYWIRASVKHLREHAEIRSVSYQLACAAVMWPMQPSHRRIPVLRWPAVSRRPPPAARRGPASWHCLVACSWCWRRWTRSTYPASAEGRGRTAETCERNMISFSTGGNMVISRPSCSASASPCGRCCPPRWTSCCCPVCPSEWFPAGRKAWARCRTAWRTFSTQRCRLWATPCRPGDSTLAERGKVGERARN